MKKILGGCYFSSAMLVAAVSSTMSFDASADRTEFSNLARSPFVHCAFYRGYDSDPVTGELVLVEGRAAALVHFQRIDVAKRTARAIDTRVSGARTVTVMQTDKAIHFIDNVGGMYVMTTIHSCIDFDEKRGVCVTYGAVNSRHFDASATFDPDAVYNKVKDHADPGFCDHSFIGIKEAATR